MSDLQQPILRIQNVVVGEHLIVQAATFQMGLDGIEILKSTGADQVTVKAQEDDEDEDCNRLLYRVQVLNFQADDE